MESGSGAACCSPEKQSTTDPDTFSRDCKFRSAYILDVSFSIAFPGEDTCSTANQFRSSGSEHMLTRLRTHAAVSGVSA
jgi:hypothetical protein